MRGEVLCFSEDPAWELKRREVALWSSNEDGGTGVYQCFHYLPPISSGRFAIYGICCGGELREGFGVPIAGGIVVRAGAGRKLGSGDVDGLVV